MTTSVSPRSRNSRATTSRLSSIAVSLVWCAAAPPTPRAIVWRVAAPPTPRAIRSSPCSARISEHLGADQALGAARRPRCRPRTPPRGGVDCLRTSSATGGRTRYPSAAPPGGGFTGTCHGLNSPYRRASSPGPAAGAAGLHSDSMFTQFPRPRTASQCMIPTQRRAGGTAMPSSPWSAGWRIASSACTARISRMPAIRHIRPGATPSAATRRRSHRQRSPGRNGTVHEHPSASDGGFMECGEASRIRNDR